MKSIVLYYSLGGTTRAEAARTAEALSATLYEIKETRKRTPFSAFLPGCPNALHRKASKIEPLSVNLQDYDRIVLGAPVWAGFPAPAFNAMVNLLPSGKEVEIFLCSSGGEAPKSLDGTKALIADRGCTLVSYRDVCTAPEAAKKA